MVNMEGHSWLKLSGEEGEVGSLVRREAWVVLWTKIGINLKSLSAGSGESEKKRKFWVSTRLSWGRVRALVGSEAAMGQMSDRSSVSVRPSLIFQGEAWMNIDSEGKAFAVPLWGHTPR